MEHRILVEMGIVLVVLLAIIIAAIVIPVVMGEKLASTWTQKSR